MRYNYSHMQCEAAIHVMLPCYLHLGTGDNLFPPCKGGTQGGLDWSDTSPRKKNLPQPFLRKEGRKKAICAPARLGKAYRHSKSHTAEESRPTITATQRVGIGLALICVLAAIGGCEPPALTDNGVVLTFGRQGMGPGEFGYPRAIATAPDDTFFVVDKTARVQHFDADGNYLNGWSMPENKAGKPVGLTVHPDGRVFVADTHYHRVIVFDADGIELARFGHRGSGDGQFLLPTDVAIDHQGRIYISEYNGNDRVTRWFENPATSQQSAFTFDAVIVAGEIDGQAMRRPSAMVIDDENTLWVADACNHRILRFDLDGRLLKQFGGLGTAPGQLKYPYDINIDREGNLLVCEYGNCRIQWFDREGRSLRIWGSPGRQLGQLNSPWGVIASRNGLVYVLDSQNARVQAIKL